MNTDTARTAAEAEDDLVAFFRAATPEKRRAYDEIADRDRRVTPPRKSEA